ncbi:sigma-54-dependent Fis family transcriptional re gulator [Desulfonema ishimotonii]|uniref:Sigma-54-dependent Fis family transcriptional re gulator n=1 Tax=Desulfonema ishimotonii TaxID=45657 RepID=A0A401FT48_9BACT|nr:sigma-54 dependent transcriptional regulator [Desulfonema ishimotonii]GBC60138.1 sigma-54-dependent Fis family transcriptional re gulator [Desulfonema ishimotonii]
MTKILVIDDDPEFCETMESLVSRMNYTCESAHTLRDGLEKLESEAVDVVLLDVCLPDGNGLDVLPRVREAPSRPEVIILTGKGDPDGAELAIQGGVWDYLVKPSSIRQTRLSLNRALKYRADKQTENGPVSLNTEHIIGTDPGIRACFDLLARAARSNAQVLITGETGTGKELFARTIHENSARSGHRFVVVDCASLTESLLESTLFGHKKGAFTGAGADRAGLVRLADGGTLFLDEVGDMPLSVQKSFLRVLQEKTFRPVGDTREVRSDFRLIAATHRDLEKMVEKKTFRQDLLYRLWSISIRLPPLRERTSDLKLLVMFYVNRLCEEYNLPNKGFGQDFFDVLRAYGWPGNVRELFNVVERAFVVSGGEKMLYAMHLPQHVRIAVAKASLRKGLAEPSGDAPEPAPASLPSAPPDPSVLFQKRFPTMRQFKEQAKKIYLEALIRQADGELSQIMKISGLSKSQFYALVKKHKIRMPGRK